MKSNEGERSPKTLTFTYSFVTTKKRKHKLIRVWATKLFLLYFEGLRTPTKTSCFALKTVTYPQGTYALNNNQIL